MATPPESTKTSLTQRLRAYAADIWPDHQIKTRFRGQFAYIDAVDPDGDTIALCRLRYAGSASMWGFAFYRASHDDYQNSFLPTGQTAGTPEDALDCAAGLYLTPLQTPTNKQA
ncbi:MAG: hypothetical protein IPF42_18410 [Candidatus Microthrix sp.]|jgi:choline dehydrogenase-like flavoprotein|uniref:Uncharacterized protein n=1 Tax=Candidatus Neomicrothrix subdominans TaxID=2954438 RepID=A0A936TG49_9ACTN|nr:hypothetical protein [Candidatus Microthrix sp.]MBK9297330.1 hypothetical protein [Candidatus Microthrix subdominans]